MILIYISENITLVFTFRCQGVLLKQDRSSQNIVIFYRKKHYLDSMNV